MFANSTFGISFRNDREVLNCVEDKKELDDHDHDDSSRRFRSCLASKKSLRTSNPIRALVDPIVSSSIKCGKLRGDNKDQISLALGDPSSSNDMSALSPCSVLLEAAVQCAQSRTHTGYANACGSTEAREAIAHYYSIPEYTLTQDDVVIANGCSGALELALTAMLDTTGTTNGSTILLPQPGFPLYQVIAESHGCRVKYYRLDPVNNWQVDLNHLEYLLDNGKNDDVRGIVINNPSNPCGCVYSVQHLQDILILAGKYQLPILSDEVYGDITFHGATYHPLSHVAARLKQNNGISTTRGHIVVPPVITASGLGKQFLVPGWRVGWLIFHDCTGGALEGLKDGIKRLAQVILGASHLTQGVIPAVLTPSSRENATKIHEWKGNFISILEKQSTFCFNRINMCHGLSCERSHGAMYAMVKIHIEKFDDAIQNDFDFTKVLLEEENVVTLPGAVFYGSSNCNCENNRCYFRIMFCASTAVLDEAFLRIQDFCSRHAVA
mmetsp:Transcript_19314/g.27523  ORF Transcript_19314/g.27523 Transcript_19314/m.27523 type:complete len:496 (-) Transcript_19314:167-1654(-)